jgi:nicotinate phosphoribosyltransferase
MIPVVESLLETDLYKFTMWQALLHQHPASSAEYTFWCRNQPPVALGSLRHEVSAQLDHLCSLRFSASELSYLASLRFIKRDFVDFLRIFQFQRDFISVQAEGDQLRIVARGPQVHVMGFEIFVLAIVNEIYFRQADQQAALAEGRRRLDAKIKILRTELRQGEQRHPFEFFDFGLRRRFSGAWHRQVVATLARDAADYFRGTSNVLLAQELGLRPMGTMAHEYLQTFQALGVQLRQSQQAALEAWVREYRGDLGIALTDVVGMDAFLSDFDLYFAKLFDGLRHDSGDPVRWGEKALAHYARLGLDAHAKRLVFSDGLTVTRAIELYRHFADRIQVGFGIGTHLTNDVGLIPLNVVMKLTRCNDQPVAKLSDSPGKTLCVDETFLAYLRQVFRVTEPAGTS